MLMLTTPCRVRVPYRGRVALWWPRRPSVSRTVVHEHARHVAGGPERSLLPRTRSPTAARHRAQAYGGHCSQQFNSSILARVYNLARTIIVVTTVDRLG